MPISPTVCVFEDEATEAFLPLSYTRPVFDLRCGMRTLFEKIACSYREATMRTLCRPYLTELGILSKYASFVGETRDPDLQVLFVNGRLMGFKGLANAIPISGDEELFVSGSTLVAARISGPRMTIATKWLAEQDTRSVIASVGPEVTVTPIEAVLASYPWDLIHANGSEIANDFQALVRSGKNETIHPAAAVYGVENVYVDPTAEVMASAVLDARGGPIIVDQGARVEPFSFIQGPSYIGPHSRIVSGRIREDTSIGPYCRVGGEVESSIFHGYSNKYHDGFVGHTYLGEWVNVGALTTTSDLKNTYGTVRVEVRGEQMDTDLTKLGSIVGDHVKLGIGVLLNSGTTIGTGCNLFGGGMLPKVIPCFVWGGDGEFQEYDFDRMLETAQIAMSRREVEQTPDHIDLLRYVFELTAPLRRSGRI